MSGHAISPASRGPVDWAPAQLAELAIILPKYPTKKAAIMPVLWLAQDTFEWIDLDVMRLVAKTLDLPPSHVHAVATFYTMFKKAPTGKYLIQVCHTLSCAIVGADAIIAHLERSLGCDEAGNSGDGLFSVVRVECLAACGSAPMAQINEHFYERLTPAIVDEIIASLRSGQPTGLRPEVDRWTFPAS